MELTAGIVLEGKVTGITSFGAFVALPEGKNGLVHISEISNSYVNDIRDFISMGQTVKVRVLSVGADGKINLSIKRAEEQPRQATRPQTTQSREVPKAGNTAAVQQSRPVEQSFEDKLKKFMQDSEGKIADNKFYADHKQRNRKR